MSNKKGIVSIAKKYGEKFSAELGYDLIDVEFKKEMDNYFLRIYIDKKNGIKLDDCQIISEKISDILDKYDPVEEPYYLEVSSPGIDRPLKTNRDFDRNIGREVEITLYEPVENRKYIEGILKKHNESMLFIEVEESMIEVPKEKVSLIKLLIKF